MCVAVPGKVIAVDGTRGRVDILGNIVEADLALLENPSVGEYVIVHAGFAIQRLDEEEALATQDVFRELAAKLAADGGG